MDDENETPSNTHKEKQDLMQKALDDIMKNGPKLRLGHVPAPGKRFTNYHLNRIYCSEYFFGPNRYDPKNYTVAEIGTLKLDNVF